MPIMSGKAFVSGKISKGRAIIRLQGRLVVVSGGDVETPDAGVLKGRCGIISRTIDRGAKWRRGFYNVKLIIGRHIEDSGLTRVVNQAKRRIAIPLNHFRV